MPGKGVCDKDNDFGRADQSNLFDFVLFVALFVVFYALSRGLKPQKGQPYTEAALVREEECRFLKVRDRSRCHPRGDNGTDVAG